MDSTSTEDRLFCDNFYEAKHIESLPRDVFFGDTSLTIDYARYSEVNSFLRPMLQGASERGDNVGIDEFDGSYADFLIDYSFIFTVRWKDSKSSLAAFIIIGLSTFSRTMDPSLADIHVIRTEEVTDDTYFNLVELSVELTKQLDVGFTECIMTAATCCDNIVQGLSTRLQFTALATIPMSVAMANSVGLTDSILFLRSLVSSAYSREPRSSGEVLSLLARHGIVDGSEDDKKYEQATLPSAAFLPEKYYISSADVVVNIRNMRKDEDKVLFDLLNRTTEIGEGIALHDLPNLSFFRNVMLMEGHTIVFEELSSQTIIGFYCICPCWLTRSQQSKCAETTLLFTKQYQSRGLGREVFRLLKGLTAQLGYKRILTDFFANNIRSKRLGKDGTELGVIPRAAYVIGSGWQGQVLTYQDLSNESTFNGIVEENQNKWKSKIFEDKIHKLPAAKL